jgi:hypothetical protein
MVLVLVLVGVVMVVMVVGLPVHTWKWWWLRRVGRFELTRGEDKRGCMVDPFFWVWMPGRVGPARKLKR